MKKQFGVIFDMNGVIINSNPTHLIAWREYLKQKGVKATDEELKNHMFGRSNSYIISYFLKKEYSKERLNEMQTEKEAIFRDIFKDRFEIVKGVDKFIETLSKNNIPMGIATSAPRANMELTMAKLPIANTIHSRLA